MALEDGAEHSACPKNSDIVPDSFRRRWGFVIFQQLTDGHLAGENFYTDVQKAAEAEWRRDEGLGCAAAGSSRRVSGTTPGGCVAFGGSVEEGSGEVQKRLPDPI